jgi:protein SCO1/2
MFGQADLEHRPGTPASIKPDVTTRIGVEQKVGTPIPLDLVFTDESGRAVSLREVKSGRPMVLVPVYYDCPLLCSQVLSGLVTSLKAMNLTVGRDYDVVAVSFDPSDTPERAAAQEKRYVERYGRPGTEGGFHFLTGTQASIDALTRSIGFKYEFDPATKQFAHASAVLTVTPEGVVSHYFFGVEFPPRDLRLGIVEASSGRVGSIIDRALLLCYQYDPRTALYSAMTLSALRAGGGLTLAALSAFIVVSRLRERRTARARPGAKA